MKKDEKRWDAGFHYSVAHFLDYSRTAIAHYRTMMHISGKLVRLFGLQSNENVRGIAYLSDSDAYIRKTGPTFLLEIQ